MMLLLTLTLANDPGMLWRPMRKMYPSRLMGNQQRSFNAAWFDTYCWLEYSVEMDVVLLFFTDPGRDPCFVRTQFLLPPSD